MQNEPGRKARLVTISTLCALAVLVVAAWITFATPVAFCAFFQEDEIDASYCRTHELLQNYDEEPEEVIDWLLAYNGEAAGQTVMAFLTDWAIENPDRFIDLLSRLNESASRTTIDRLVWAIHDTGQKEQFVGAFATRTAENANLDEIIQKLRTKIR